jgi:hypothetical protein
MFIRARGRLNRIALIGTLLLAACCASLLFAGLARAEERVK